MVITENLKKGLQVIGFQLDETEKSSIVFVSELENPTGQLPPFQILELEKALSFKADAIFFRYFEDNRPPLAQVYIYDNSNNRLNSDYTQIHRELWSSCRIPTFIVIENTKIKFFDSRKPVSIHSNGNIYTKEIAAIDLDNIAQYADILEKYNAEKFKNGSFWESEEARHNYLYGETAYNKLIEKLKALRKDYKKSSKISSHLFDYVIIITTLIKFLEENGVDFNGDNLAGKFFRESVQCGSFIEILKQKKLANILEKLSIKFNGGIFDLSEQDKNALRVADLSQIITFFDTKIDNKNQLVLWDLYSFKHIPVELISNIYEEFLPVEDKGAVYTPHYLVKFLIDESLPIPTLNNPVSYNRKTIDVSCGSGIFLVNCFKRLVQIYKINECYKTNSLSQTLDITTLQKILKDNIFGVDINKNAVELTKFSLQLALCQMLSPKQIWTELTFQDLGKKNIIQSDFFDFITNEKVDKNFDLVIGNPPFNPPPKPDGSEYKNSDYFNQVVEKNRIKPYSIKDSNVALLFLQLSTKLLKNENSLLCLIQPALPLLHKKDNEVFRQELFSNHNVLQIIDFTTHRRILFPSATIPTCAIFIENSEKKNEEITHVVIRRTNPSKERLYFEIDTYDIHSVKRENASSNYYWKSNLFGGYRLLNLVLRLKKLDDIENFRIENGINYKKGVWSKNQSLDINNGFFIDSKITYGKFPYFTTKESINTKTLGFFGDKKSIKFLKNYLIQNGKLLCSFIAGTSSAQGVDRPYYINKDDIDNLPLINDAFNLTIAENILIDDIAEYKISEFGNGENANTNKEIQVKANNNLPDSLVDYSKVYSDALNSVYEVNNKKFALKTFYNTPACFILHYEYSNSDYTVEIIKNNEVNLSTLIRGNKQTIDIKKVSLIYSQNQIFIMKPKPLRYWLKSIALLDVDTTIADIINLNLVGK